MARPKRAAASKKKIYVPEDEVEEEGVQRDETSQVATEEQEEAEEPEEYVEDEQEDAEEFVPTKKARMSEPKGKGKGKAKAKVRGRAGKLKSMVNLPIDVWYMIAEHLDPPSLLYMGRANKMMRSLFASNENSRGLWNVVKRSIHLPDLEAPDLTDLALTSLIYERDCHVCGKARAVLVDYCLRKRWCKKCRSNNLVLANRIRTQVANLDVYTLACSLTTTQGPTNYNWNGKRYVYKADVIEINDELLELQQAIGDAKGKDEKRAAKSALADYVTERKAIVKAAFEDGKKLATWERSSAKDRKDADTAARQARKDAIKAKLKELGYEDQDMRYLYEVSNLMDKPATLTPTIWNKISSKIIAAVEKNKQERLVHEARRRADQRRNLVMPYYDALKAASGDQDFFPSFNLFASMPSVQVFWKEEESTIDEDIWHSNLDKVQGQIPKVQRWMKLEMARALVEARQELQHPVPDDLRSSIHPRKVRSPEEVEEARTYGYGRGYSTALDVDDTSTISSSDLDALLSRFTSTFATYISSGYYRWKEFADGEADRFFSGLSVSSVPRNWLKVQIEVLKQTGIADDDETNEKLEQLGPKFSCYDCHKHLPYRPSYSWLAPTAQNDKPEKSDGLTWNEMFHSSNYFSSHVSGSPRILYADRKPGSIEEPAPPVPLPGPAPVSKEESDEVKKEEDGQGEVLIVDGSDDAKDTGPVVQPDDTA
ncbi:F-box protein [Sporobolomyces salmoneus]|uniref:F-box protein n=1 Tax=Sporobolomyces salmoneus TaxID=183962 RepID=UPI003172EB51